MSDWKPGERCCIPVTGEMLDLSGKEAYLVPCRIRDADDCSPGAFNLDDLRGPSYARWDNVPSACLREPEFSDWSEDVLEMFLIDPNLGSVED